VAVVQGGVVVEPRGLKEEIKKRHSFECPEQEAALNLARTADGFQIEAQRFLKGHGLTGGQYNLLRILRGEGIELSCQEVASRMITQVPDITRLVDRLESAGLVERRRTSEDRRLVLLKITPRGIELLQAIDDPILALHRRQLGHLSRDELAELNRLLVKARRQGQL
jgi:DNA-binding MarR family transcriptional regulator